MFAAAAAVVGAMTPALAQGPQYSPDDLVNFMLKSAQATRGVCVGTAQQCAEMAKPAGFDMMVNFELNSATLTDEARLNLQQVGKALGDSRLHGIRFEVDGYTDASGTVQYNDALSARRAASVTDFLVAQGVDPSRLSPVGRGEASPRVADPYDPLTRRVEIRLSVQ
jgi:outer membrane protein OmpA-like peptidoglycan-associated protein